MKKPKLRPVVIELETLTDIPAKLLRRKGRLSLYFTDALSSQFVIPITQATVNVINREGKKK